jgi:predicted glycosyltransferase
VRVLIEILHPAHVHFFRHLIGELEGRGHDVLVTSRRKDVATELLDAYGIPHRILSAQGRSGVALAVELWRRSRLLVPIIREFRPDVLIGIMGPTIALAGRWTGVPSVVFYDTETARLTNPWVFRLATAVCTPQAFPGRVPGRHVTYPGYHDLAYLHPARFTPDPARLRAFGIEPGRPFTLARFVSFQASHDVGDRGLSPEGKAALLRHLSTLGDVYVSTEGPLPPGLPGRPLSGPVTDIHHVLAAARLVVGDSGTMSTEAAVLGTPAVFVSTARLGVLRDLERRYGLLACVPSVDVMVAIAAAERLSAARDAGSLAEARMRLLGETVDVTSWMVEFFGSTTLLRSA